MKSKRRILILGAGRHQKNLIKKAEAQGIETIVSDYYTDSPGKQFCSISTMTDALNIEANIELAKKYRIDGVITTGTDQALTTMAHVAYELSLPCYLSINSAEICTNKQLMIDAIEQSGLNKSKSVIATNFQEFESAFDRLSLPVIIKPVDSQGQRGISICNNKDNLSNQYLTTIQHSKNKKIVIEEFICGPEITVSAWLQEGNVHILMITDRVTYNKKPAFGVAFQHIYPSRYAMHLTDEIKIIIKKLTCAYNVYEGPIYVQMVINNDNLYIIEGTCRIGGGHEETLIPIVSGLDTNQLLIELALEEKTSKVNYNFNPESIPGYYLINFLLAKPGKITSLQSPSLEKYEEIISSGFYQNISYEQKKIINAQGRNGFFIVKANNHEDLLFIAKAFYKKHHILNQTNHEMLFWPDNQYMNL